MFIFNYADKMVPIQKELTHETKRTYTIAPEEVAELELRDGDSIYGLITNGEYSVLIGQNVYTEPETNEFKFDVDPDLYTVIGSPITDMVTAWITPTAGQDHIHISSDLVTQFPHDETEEYDPTGGSWLLLKTKELTYEEGDSSVADRRVYVNKEYRDVLSLYNGELTVRIETESGGVAEGSITMPETSNKITIPEGMASEAGISKTGEDTHVWVSTASLAENYKRSQETTSEKTEPTSVSDDAVDSTVESNAESNGLEFSADNSVDDVTEHVETTPETGTDVVDETDSDDEERGVETEDEDTVSVGERETESEDSALDDGSDGGDDEGSVREDSVFTGGVETVNELRELQETVEREFIPTATPVVILDDEERLQETWTGHYLQEDGELLCGKEYTGIAKDRDGKHYDEVCTECARKKPGALTEKDIGRGLEQFLDISFGTQEPYVLTKEDGAKLLKTIAELMLREETTN